MSTQESQQSQAWKDRGACVGSDPEIFFPGQWDMVTLAVAKGICDMCPVQAECLEYGIQESQGVWGGTSERERRRIRTVRRKAGIAAARQSAGKVVQHRKPSATVPT